MNLDKFIDTQIKGFYKELKSQVRTKVFWKDLVVVLLGVLTYLLGFCTFIYPQRITTGGLSGLSNLITLSTGINIAIPYNVINITLFFVAFILLDKMFLVKTLVGVFLLGLLFPIFATWSVPDPSNEAYWHLRILADSPALALVLGSIFTGIGLGLVFSVNGSTGGTDIVVSLINKYKNIPLGRLFITVDGTIVAMSYFVNVYFAKITVSPEHALNLLVYSILNVVIVSMTLDWYVNGNKQSVQFMIFSNKHKEINEAITKRFKRGCTILEGTGGYTGLPVKVLVVVVRKRRSVGLGRLISEIDPKAFVSQCNVSGVYGEGFDNMTKLK